METIDKKKDWTGGHSSVFITKGCTGHSLLPRVSHDYYATSPQAIERLFASKDFSKPNSVVWECACGEGHLSKVLEKQGMSVISSDLIDRGFGRVLDFLKTQKMPQEDCSCIITNPPYKFATEFILHALELLPPGGRALFFLKTTFLEGVKRRQILFDHYKPYHIYQFSSRIICARNGDFVSMEKIGSAVSYAWFEFVKGINIPPQIFWI